MDCLRYVLALAVIVSHTRVASGWNFPFPISSFEAVGGFFALSGFLMYPNYVRHDSFIKYTAQRACRILPPYFFIVILSAVCLVAVSSLSPVSYFTSSGFYAYLAANLSFLNWLHPGLPGVFDGPEFDTTAVNASLWTMKVEWCLYFSVPIFVWLVTRLRFLRKHWLAFAVILLSISYRLLFNYLYNETGRELYSILGRQIFGQLAYFYCGMLIYFIKEYFKDHLFFFGISGLLLYLLSPVSQEISICFSPFAISILVLSISLFPKDLKILRHKGNVSYEMYLFHYPILQLSIFLGIFRTGLWQEFGFVIGATAVLSVIAQRLIKKLMSRLNNATIPSQKN